MEPREIGELRLPSNPMFHPDGRRIVYVVSQPNFDEDRYERALWLWDGSASHPFTHGPHDTGPQWSPDGSRLAFLRKGADEEARPQVAVMPADGGEATIVTDLPLGVTSLRWSPDGQRLAVSAPTWLPDVAELDDDERKRRPRRIAEVGYRRQGDGFTHDRPEHLYVVDPGGDRETIPLTSGMQDDIQPSWVDDATILFRSPRHEDHEFVPGEQVCTIDVETLEVTTLTGPGFWEWSGVGPDGEVYALGLPSPWDWPAPMALHRIRAGEDPQNLSADLDRHADPPLVTFAESNAFFAVEDRGRVHLYRQPLDGGGHERLIGGDRTVTGFATSPDGSNVAFVATTPDRPDELFLWDGSDERSLTDLNGAFGKEIEVRPTEAFMFERDGVEIDAWAVVPDGPGPWPIIVNIHGGPTAQYGHLFFDEFQVYSGAGYLVVGCNPRGSSGRGRDWSRAVVGVWHEDEPVDMADLDALADAALARYPQADADRIGIMGGSYGGFATARIIAATDRYKSAIVERALLDWRSFAGTADIGPTFDRLFLEAAPPNDWSTLEAASPVARAHTTTTPTLVLHSEEDYRCPIEQAESYFVALRRAGVDAEFVRFPGESHELSRSGSPKHRVERFEIILDWHARHLGD